MRQTKYSQIPTFNVARLTNSAHKLFHEEIIEKLQQQEVPNPQLAELVRRYREAFARAAAPILCGIPHTVEAALSCDGA